jgi:putative glutamine amidotransferase
VARNTKALVGMTTYTERVSWGTRTEDVALIQRAYFELVAAAGGRPLLLPPSSLDPLGPMGGAPETIAALDALVVIGGLDVDPKLYGAEPDRHLGRIDDVRDSSELALLATALETDLPVLAICRGQQLLNVLLGGTLHQHLPDLVGHLGHQPGDGIYADQEIRCEPGTRTEAIFGSAPVVRCSHHQAIDKLGEGLVITARAARDDVIEAVELPSARFCVSVQWHPEEPGDVRPFEALIAAC